MIPEDITGSDWQVALRGQWHALESHDGVSFRWARNNAQIIITTFVPVRRRVLLDLEPGPSVVASTFALKIFDSDGETLFDDIFVGRKTVEVSVVATRPTVQVLRLHAPNGGNPAWGQETRILDFRVFSIRSEPEASDIAPIESACRTGRGWSPIEQWAGLRFRWVDNDARIIVEDSDAADLALDIEPGPGLGGEPLELVVTDNSLHVLAAFRLFGRDRVVIPLPARTARPCEIVLHAAGGGKRTPGDDRILNFRVFCETQ